MWIFYGEITCRAGHPRHAKQIQATLSEIQIVEGQDPHILPIDLSRYITSFTVCYLEKEIRLGYFEGRDLVIYLTPKTDQLCPLVQSLSSLNPKGELDSAIYIVHAQFVETSC